MAGFAFIILGDQSYGGYPRDFAWFGQGYIGDTVISFELVLFLVAAVIFYILLHHTNFGRRIFAIGNNPTAAQFSGVRVDRIKFVLFCLTGVMSGITAVLLTARLGSGAAPLGKLFELTSSLPAACKVSKVISSSKVRSMRNCLRFCRMAFNASCAKLLPEPPILRLMPDNHFDKTSLGGTRPSVNK